MIPRVRQKKKNKGKIATAKKHQLGEFYEAENVLLTIYTGRAFQGAEGELGWPGDSMMSSFPGVYLLFCYTYSISN